ncbi:MAG TPA: TlpA disulfide reductase family protein [Pyrinomonadaceae bacterium]|nr:TlpA disulfide reductase family protein [Pyrinomonadaceae bacterium]
MPLKIGDAMPELEGATTWINGSLEDIREQITGKPTLVHFWSVSCGICKDKMPQLNEIKKKYGTLGLQTIAVHMPRYEADTDLDIVYEVMNAHEIDEPTAVDSLHRLKDAFQNEQGWVPVYYLFDTTGKLKTRAAGEFGLGVLQSALDRMFVAETVAA